MARLLDQLAAERKAERAKTQRDSDSRHASDQAQLARENVERELATIQVRLEFLAPAVAEAAALEKRRKQLRAR